MSIIGIIILLIIAIGFFAPQLGSFFGLFSKNRNVQDDSAIIKPNAPILSNIPKASNTNTISFNGYAQPGMAIKLYVNGPEVANITVSADGIFSFTDIKLNDGQNTIFAKAVDTHNVESDVTKTTYVYVDKEKPKIEILSPKDGDIIKNLDKRIQITGKINEKCSVKINDRIAVVKPDLTFETLMGVSNEGSVKIKIEATDEAGNTTTKEISVRYEKESL